VIDHVYQGRVREASQLASENMALIEAIGDAALTVGLSTTPIVAKIDKGAKLPKSIGTMPATGGGRNRRGRVTGRIGQSAKQAGAARSRVKLIG
jgi:hypothetical protein